MRVRKVPYLGICLGMQLAVIEFARHMAGLEQTNSTEFDHDTPQPVVALITEWMGKDGQLQKRDGSGFGGTMRWARNHVRSRPIPGTLIFMVRL